MYIKIGIIAVIFNLVSPLCGEPGCGTLTYIHTHLNIWKNTIRFLENIKSLFDIFLYLLFSIFLSIAITYSHTIAIVYSHSIILCTLSVESAIISEVYNISSITISSTLSNLVLHTSCFNWACKFFIFVIRISIVINMIVNNGTTVYMLLLTID